MSESNNYKEALNHYNDTEHEVPIQILGVGTASVIAPKELVEAFLATTDVQVASTVANLEEEVIDLSVSNTEFHTWHSLSERKNMFIGKGRVLGELANWAIQQSPYVVPDNLAEVITQFDELWIADYERFDTIKQFEDQLEKVGDQIPELMAWNERKNKREGHGFVTATSRTDPDDDFIDLHAMYRNIAMAAWADAVEFDNFNKDFQSRYKGYEHEETLD